MTIGRRLIAGRHPYRLRPGHRAIAFAILAMVSAVIAFGLPMPVRGQTLERIGQAVRSDDPSDRESAAEREGARSEREERRQANRTNRLGNSFGDPDDSNPSDDGSGNAAWDLTYAFGRLSFALAQGIFIGDLTSRGLDGSSEVPESGDRSTPVDERSVETIAYETDESPSDELLGDEASGFGEPRARFGRYPYADDRAGSMFEAFDGAEVGRASRATFALSSGSDFDDLQWLTGDLMFERASSRLGLGGSLTQVFEGLPNGGTDELRIGEAHLLWRRLQSDRFQWRWGVGAVIVDDRRGTNGGLAGTAQFDWFVRSPWVVSGEYDLGRAGSATYEHLRLTTGVTWKQLELAGGYDWRSFDGIDFSGPIVGLTLRW